MKARLAAEADIRLEHEDRCGRPRARGDDPIVDVGAVARLVEEVDLAGGRVGIDLERGAFWDPDEQVSDGELEVQAVVLAYGTGIFEGDSP